MAHLPTILPASQARSNFYDLIDEASKGLRKFFVTKRGRAGVVIMSQREFEGWEETNEILADKELVREIRQAEKEIEAGKGVPWEKVKKELGWK